MEIEKLIERLQNWDGIKPDREIDCAIEGLKALQAENDRLKRERDAAVKDISDLIDEVEEIRRGYGIDDSDADKALADMCGNYLHRLAAYEDTGLAPEEVQQMRWIPVEERLPEEEGGYIVCVDGEVKWDAYCMFEGVGRWLCYDGRLDALYIDPYSSKLTREPPYPRVTHWMPLPQPPKEETYEK